MNETRAFKHKYRILAQTKHGFNEISLGEDLNTYEKIALSEAIALHRERYTVYECLDCGEFICNYHEMTCLSCDMESRGLSGFLK